MTICMFPNLGVLANVCLTIPASVKQNFFQMKMIKTRLRNYIGDSSLDHLMFVAIESPDVLTDSKNVVNLIVL